MANVRRLGFIPTRQSGGGTVTFRKARVLDNNTLGIFHGDTVKWTSSGDCVACAAGTDESIVVGSVAQGAAYLDANNIYREGKYLPAATRYTPTDWEPSLASYVYVVENPVNVYFEANVANSAIALTDMDLNYSTVLTVGSTTTGLSKHELNATGRATTATIPFRAIEPVRRADNDLSLVDVKILCMINAGEIEPALSTGAAAGSQGT
jgi:hypothetical protein